MKEQGKSTAREQSKTEELPEGELKAMIIRILNGLEKRIEDIRETLNTEIKEILKVSVKDGEFNK